MDSCSLLELHLIIFIASKSLILSCENCQHEDNFSTSCVLFLFTSSLLLVDGGAIAKTKSLTPSKRLLWNHCFLLRWTKDEPNHATRASKMELSALSGLPAMSCEKRFAESQILNLFSLFLSFFFCEFTELDSVSVHKHAKWPTFSHLDLTLGQ